MLSSISRLLAGFSMLLKQPLAAFCDIETSHGDALITRQGDYLSFLRIDGMRRMSTLADVKKIATAMRVDISGALENKGQAIVGWYVSDPDLAAVEIERVNMTSCRHVAKQLGMDLTDIFDERMRLWPQVMRWEAAYFVLWTKRGVLSKEELKQMKEEQAATAAGCPRIGDAQKFFLRNEVMAAHHAGFVARIVSALKGLDIAAVELSARDSVAVSREALYRETAGSAWRATLVGDRVMPRLPEDDVKRPNKEGLLWPSLRSQIFHLRRGDAGRSAGRNRRERICRASI